MRDSSDVVLRGSLTFTAGNDVLVVPVTFDPIVPGPPPLEPPMTASTVNAASQLAGPVSPGEIVSIHGRNLGQAPDVFFDGTRAVLLYDSASQMNAIVPSAVANGTVTMIEVRGNGYRYGPWGMPVAAAAPGIFTVDGSGRGQAAVLNQDNSLNNPSLPAARGSVLQIFATGARVSDPIGVTIGGHDAAIQFAGPAPNGAAGLFQINAIVPDGVAPASDVPIVITAGSSRSQKDVTIAVQ